MPSTESKGYYVVRYETLFLTIPDFTNDEFSSFESVVHKTVQEAKGVMISFERWGKYHLAYPVRKNSYGIYGLVRFEVDATNKHSLLQALNALFTLKYGDSVMRTLTVALDPKRSLAYHRPESLEETPVREVDVFMKDKMDGARPSRIRTDDGDDDDDESETGFRKSKSYDRAVAAATPPAEGN